MEIIELLLDKEAFKSFWRNVGGINVPREDHLYDKICVTYNT